MGRTRKNKPDAEQGRLPFGVDAIDVDEARRLILGLDPPPDPPPPVDPPRPHVERFFAFARTSDPWTSHAAAANCNASKLEFMVLVGLQAIGRGTQEMTTEEVERRFPEYFAHRATSALASCSPRFAPLERKGLIERAGTMKTRCRENAAAYRLTPAGEAHVALGYQGRRQSRTDRPRRARKPREPEAATA